MVLQQHSIPAVGIPLLKQPCVAQRQGYRHTPRGHCKPQARRAIPLFRRERAGVLFQTKRAWTARETNLATAELHVGPTVNLRTARKQAKRRLAEQAAARSRLAHGRTKEERALARSQSDKAQKKLDQHRIERKDRP
jgi:uncharacterized protein DUF4169